MPHRDLQATASLDNSPFSHSCSTPAATHLQFTPTTHTHSHTLISWRTLSSPIGTEDLHVPVASVLLQQACHDSIQTVPTHPPYVHPSRPCHRLPQAHESASQVAAGCLVYTSTTSQPSACRLNPACMAAARLPAHHSPFPARLLTGIGAPSGMFPNMLHARGQAHASHASPQLPWSDTFGHQLTGRRQPIAHYRPPTRAAREPSRLPA